MEQQLCSDYAVFKDKKLIVEVFTGTVLPDSVANTKTIQSQDPNFSYVYDMISDFRDTFFNTLMININGFHQFLIDNKIPYGDTHRVALLVSTQNQFVHADLFVRLKSNDMVRCFFSIEEALEWLGREDEKDFIEEEAAKLKNDPRIKKSVSVDY